MRSSLFCIALIGFAGCGSSTTTNDMNVSSMDMSMTGGGDMSGAITPFNMPGKVFCYGSLTCDTTSSNPVCCDFKNPDGGFSDQCVATAMACTTLDSRATPYACGQAADCGSGMVCCGDIGTSSKTGKMFFKDTVCAASCTSSQTQLCVSASECKTSGAKCNGADISGRDVGLCQ